MGRVLIRILQEKDSLNPYKSELFCTDTIIGKGRGERVFMEKVNRSSK
jgi:hypothetical protein